MNSNVTGEGDVAVAVQKNVWKSDKIWEPGMFPAKNHSGDIKIIGELVPGEPLKTRLLKSDIVWRCHSYKFQWFLQKDCTFLEPSDIQFASVQLPKT